MIVYTISKDDLKKAYCGKPYNCDIKETAQPVEPVDYDQVLLQIMLDNYHPEQMKRAA